MDSWWSKKTVAITGGTGSLGRALSRRLLQEDIRALRVISRDEFKGATYLREFTDPRAKYLIGDVRDKDRLRLAFAGVDVVIHAAAYKRVEFGESDPLDFIKTNVGGAENVITAARECGVARCLLVSTDKAAAPHTLYGGTKMLAERLFVAANVYTPNGTIYAACRYGNVAGSRGSLIPLLMEQRESGVVTITNSRMSRFYMRMSEAVELVVSTVETMRPSEIHVPKIPSVWVRDVVEAVAPGCEVRVVGIRAAEKLHETLVTQDEARSCEDRGDRYVIKVGTIFDEAVGFLYSSDQNDRWLNVKAIMADYPSAVAEAA